MLCELAVDNIGTYVDVITQIDAEQQYRMWFRGQSDYSWGLVPSVQRKMVWVRTMSSIYRPIS